MRFVLNGCDIFFIAEAPEDMTLGQLIKQADRIEPDYCACGVCSLEYRYGTYGHGGADFETEIFFSYDDVWKANEDVSCRIKGEK